MAGGGGGSTPARELDHTPTWAVALVCAVIVVISIILEKLIHLIGEWFQERRKKALYEALEKIKGELMVLGFISLILTFGQNYIIKICIPTRIANTMLPCPKEAKSVDHLQNKGRRLQWYERRFLGADNDTVACKVGYVPLISLHGLHQLHIFIFFLAVFHVIYSAITMLLGRLKIRAWKVWERETAAEVQYMNDPTRFRLTHETSFVRDHTNFWMKNPFTFYIICFFRQFFRSVRSSDYLTMRHGFISVHLAPGSKFDFQKYIKRSLEDDFKVVVGISPLLWASVVLFLLLNVSGWAIMYVVSILPLLVILAVGTKLQGIISQMALEIQERHAVVQGIPLVQVSDTYFWFGWPQLVLYLIHFVLFQNAFEITYFFWIWVMEQLFLSPIAGYILLSSCLIFLLMQYEFGLRSCFHDDFVLVVTRVVLGFAVQFLCSYITLPLYALVTQMGSNMKRSIFDEQTSKALRQWHKKAKKKSESRSGILPVKTLGIATDDSRRSSVREVEMPTVQTDGVATINTANIMASVDIDVDNQQTNDKKLPERQPDLLS